MPIQPLISVIVPVYNVEQYLRKCLDSICGQTYDNLEILCVNDGSSDGSAFILEEYAAKDPRIKIITQENKGLSAARNTAIDNATGEWIAGVDSDDYLEPDAFEYAFKAVSDDTDIVCYGVKVHWQNVSPDIKMEHYFELKYSNITEPSNDILAHMPVTFWDKMWRRSFVEHYHVRFPVGLWYEDTYFFFALAPFARKISFRPEKKYNYLRREGSIMSKTNAKTPKTLDRLRIADAILDFYHHHPLPPEMRKIRLFSFIVNFFSDLPSVPDAHMKQYMQLASDIAYQYELITEYPAQIRYLKRVPWWLKLFVKHKINKSYYGLPGLRLIKITRFGEREIIRFLGIKVRSSNIQLIP